MILAQSANHQDVDAEAIHSAVEPEAQHVHHGRPHLGVAPIEVRLLVQEGMQIILAGRFVPLP